MKCSTILCFVAIIILGCSDRPKPKHADEEQAHYSSISMIPQKGDPYNDGVTHGEMLKNEIQLQISNWEEGICGHLDISRDSILSILLNHTGFLNTIRSHDPDLLEELKGIAEGAEVDLNLLTAYNLGEEIFNYCTANFESCSNIGFQSATENILSYNQDLPKFLHGNSQPVVLAHPDHYIFTMPGQLALSGVSNKIAVSCNSLPMLKMNPNGLPLAACIRSLLKCKSIEEAINLSKNTPFAIPQNLMIAGDERMVNLEISAGAVKELKASNGYLIHTNFPIENDEYKDSLFQTIGCDRYDFLRSTISYKPSSFEDLDSICSQSPILNDETYLRYTVRYGGDHIQLLFINPSSTERIELTFD